MRLFFVLLLCIATTFAVPFKQSSAIPLWEYAKQTPNRIIDGVSAVRGQIPWQAAIQGFAPEGAWFCGGSIISKQWILTAAHCAVSARYFVIWVGGLTTSEMDNDRLVIQTSTSIVHEGYNEFLNNDVALIKLPYELEFSDTVSAVRLPSRGERLGDGKLVQISGWGRISDASGVISDVLKYVHVTTIPNEKCAEIYGEEVVIDSTVCAVGNPHHSTCNGDSGGPLVYIGEDGLATLHGVISFVHTDGCGTGNPSGYVRTESMLDWIAANAGLDV